jgi:hypothetical protein
VKVSLSFCRGGRLTTTRVHFNLDWHDLTVPLIIVISGWCSRSKVKIEDIWLKSTVPLETPLSVDKQKKMLRGWKHSNSVLDCCYYMFFTDDELVFSEFSKKNKCFSGWKIHPVSESHLHGMALRCCNCDVKLQFKDLLPTSFFNLFTGSQRNHIAFPPVLRVLNQHSSEPKTR